jgi:hypothetical protein
MPWRCNELLIRTEHGLFVWSSHYSSRGHVFYPLKDNELWEWF